MTEQDVIDMVESQERTADALERIARALETSAKDKAIEIEALKLRIVELEARCWELTTTANHAINQSMKATGEMPLYMNELYELVERFKEDA